MPRSDIAWFCWQEMSGGDLQRQNMSTASVRRGKEFDDSEVFTFKPKLNVVPGVQSRLKVSSDPENYLSRVEHEQRLAQRQQIKNAQVIPFCLHCCIHTFM